MKQVEIFPDIKNKIINVASVPQRSPFRYPGGKTWFIPRLREWIKNQPQKPKLFVEPFAGGGIASLTAISESLVDRVIMSELDVEVASVWEVVTSGDAQWLIDKILNFDMTFDNALHEINKDVGSTRDQAFKTIIKNRCCHGGILTAGAGLLKHGEAGKGVASRWYPDTLARRFAEIDDNHKNISFIREDAFDVLNKNIDNKDAIFFVDPPYTAGGKKAGKRLYTHHDVNHELLFETCCSLSGDFIMTYDNSQEAWDLAKKHNLDVQPVAMRNTHHAKLTELVIGRDLSWMEDINTALEMKAASKTKAS